MKKCFRCGRENDSAAIFCVDCGARISETNANDAPPPTIFNNSFQNTKFEIPAAVSPKKNNKALFLILGSVVFVAFLLIGAGIVGALFLLLSGQSSQTANSNANIERANQRVSKIENSQSKKNDSSPATLFAVPTAPTKQGRFVVSADSNWQLSDIKVVANELFRTKVSGKVDLAGVESSVSAKGVDDEESTSRRLFPEFPTGALIMRTRYANGEYSNMQAVIATNATGVWQNNPDEIGRLEFTVNDNSPTENSGQFTVDVTLIRVPK